MEFEFEGKNVKIDDEYWSGSLVEEIGKKIQADPKLLARYEEGETLNGLLTTTFIGEQGKEEELEIPITIKKPIPLLGKVILQLPEGGLKLEFPKKGLRLNIGKLKTSKRITLDKTELIQKEEGIIEQVED